jgi:predicted nucleic acid-binding Zn ribbon protein
MKKKKCVNDISQYKEIPWAKTLQVRHSNIDGVFKNKCGNELGNGPHPVPHSFTHYTIF